MTEFATIKTDDWKVDMQQRRARVVLCVDRPRSAEHAEAAARESMPEGWLFGGAVSLGHGWYRVWAYLPAAATA